MTKQELREAIRKIIKTELTEASPAPAKPATAPGVKEPPAKTPGKKEPRRPLGNPNVKPQPKATMEEASMLAQIVKRFKSKKIDEAGKTWAEGYEEGYNDGFKDATQGKSNKFKNFRNV